MENVYLLLIIFMVCWYFIYLRKLAEAALAHANSYCQTQSLQFIAIARRTSHLKFNKKHGLYWHSVFEFEFSGDGESAAQGLIYMNGLKLDSMDLPAYRVH